MIPRILFILGVTLMLIAVVGSIAAPYAWLGAVIITELVGFGLVLVFTP